MSNVKLLEVHHVNYSYKDKEKKDTFSLQDIEFGLEKGYILALLGLNGAGKSTLFELLMGNVKADSGSIRFLGKDIAPDDRDFLQRIAFISDKSCFPEYCSLEESAELFGTLYEKFDKNSWEHYMISFGFSEKQEQQNYGELSLGEKRKFQLAFALSHEPELILMDEPTANLDAGTREEWMELIQRYVTEKEISVIISTHVTGDLDRIADYILLLDKGKMLLYMDREQMVDKYGEIELSELLLLETEGKE